MLKSRLFYSPFLILLVLIALSLIFIKPRITEIQEIQTTIKMDSLRLSRLTEKASILRSMDASLLKSRVELVVEALPSEKDVPTFLSTLELISSEASVSVVSVQTSPGKISTESAQVSTSSAQRVASGQEGKIPLTVVMEGPFSGIKLFTARVASALPLQSIDSFTFTFDRNSRGNSQDIFGTVTSDFSLGFHYQFLPKFIGKVSDRIEKVNSEEEKLFSTISTFTRPQVVSGFVQTGRPDPFAQF